MTTAETNNVIRAEVYISSDVHVSLWRDGEYVKIRLSNKTTAHLATRSIPVTHVRSLVSHGYRKSMDIELSETIARIGGMSIKLNKFSLQGIMHGLINLVADCDMPPLIAKTAAGKFVFNAMQVVAIMHQVAKNTCRIAVYETDTKSDVKPGVQCDLNLTQFGRLLLGEDVNTGGTTVKLGSGHLWITFNGESLMRPVSYMVEPDDHYNFTEVRNELLTVYNVMKKVASDALFERVSRFQETTGFSLIYGDEITLNTGAITVRIHGATDTPNQSTVFIDGPMGDIQVNVPTADLIKNVGGALSGAQLKLSAYGVTMSVNVGNSALIRALIQAELADDCSFGFH